MLRRLYEGAATESRPGRPVGVAIIAVLSLISALLVAYYALGGLYAFASGATNIDTTAVLMQLILGAALVALLIAIAVGLWRLKRWAKWLSVASLVAAVVVITVDALARYGLETASRQRFR